MKQYQWQENVIQIGVTSDVQKSISQSEDSILFKLTYSIIYDNN